MNRRNFIQLGTSAGVAALLLPNLGHAGSKPDSHAKSMAGGVYYTKSHPGHWSKKIAPHLPIIEKENDGGKLKIRVVTSHPMKAHEHYITKHILLDHDFNFITEFLFDPLKHSAAISNFTLENYQGPLYALSHCNQHDTWLNSVDV